ncbi:gliding motility-associated C-terminal domain-containing protein [Taibaiella koreensis]|uniref:gliding motility-associated C-terminal domain-containing protein n=1 Tax=Taibaiella koreensis TaxID=1268548 RepID=UPI000E59B8B6|nr:gliding motility-associated C-terminal domain-containing protein [Taibaiella koreensis]
MKYWSGLLILFVFGVFDANAQLLPPNRPEQDACGALEICGNGFYSPYSYQGHGLVFDLPNTPCNSPGGSPPGAGEDNAMWLKLKVTAPGTIVFTITPVMSLDDYDWAMLSLGTTPCSAVSSANVIRCNFNNNVPIGGAPPNNGITGLNNTSTLISVPAGFSGNPYCRRIDAVAGEVFLIMINNFGAGGTPSSGFRIDFSGSTAVFNDQIPPRMVSVSSSCFTATEAIVQLSEAIKCSSIALNGSDFAIPGATISAAEGINCNASNQGYTDRIRLTFSPALAGGVYSLQARTGSDGNTLLDLCDNPLALPASLVLNVFPDNSVTHTLDTIGCGSLVYKGVTYTQSTVLRDTIRGQGGCDSIYNVTNIKVYREPDRFEETVGDCDTVIFRGKTYLEDATVIDTFRSQQGCDSFLHIYNIYVEHFELSVTADPPEPVKGDYVLFTTSANVPDYSINAWYPQNVFPRQFGKDHSILIQQSDTVKVIGTSALGCVDTAVLYIKADSLIPVFIMPNAFSPNGDGLNDVFEPKFVNKSGYVVKSFKIFNRWGQLVYLAEGTRKASWNGYYYNKDKRAEPGTYYYYIRVEFIDGTKDTVKGDVTIVP